jgi:hypothetical protein
VDGRDGLSNSFTAVDTKLTNLEAQITGLQSTIKEVGIGLYLAIVAAVLTVIFK